MSKTKAVAVLSKEQKQIVTDNVGNMFSDIDFDGLNKIIDNIGNIKGEVTDEQRKLAGEYIDEWKDIVLRRLQDKGRLFRNLHEILSSRAPYDFFAIERMYDRGNDETASKPFNAFLQLRGTIQDEKVQKGFEELDKVYEIFDEFDTYKYKKPDMPILDEDNMTANQIVNAQMKYNTAITKYNQGERKLKFKLEKAFNMAIRQIISNQKVREFAKTIKAELEKSENAFTVAKEKAALAKMNVYIPNADLRKVLRELSEFQKNI